MFSCFYSPLAEHLAEQANRSSSVNFKLESTLSSGRTTGHVVSLNYLLASKPQTHKLQSNVRCTVRTWFNPWQTESMGFIMLLHSRVTAWSCYNLGNARTLHAIRIDCIIYNIYRIVKQFRSISNISLKLIWNFN